MSIKIVPEKLDKIQNHKTRHKIKNTTYANKELISRANHLASSNEVANKQLHKLNIPYLQDTDIIYYSATKIIVRSNKEILKAKIKELHQQFIDILQKHTMFSKLQKIEIQIEYDQNTKKIIKQDNTQAKKQISKLKESLS
ncbi:hypothetical protein [Francisella adeliensis]|uniref:Uncharacterized protein n=1 Tax=Francisella adeliensis TaxID=2007306 RepID=A0A2Z4XYV2_9GAMM|nr:hypothetical protein [Francisella adeliensis]AXA33652.1 hypothetical protein CDH04_04155 [Francisella adeliensis]MBK2085543.1 hypothetical protein [Francisella adeliensis]MBK2097421.1 hypothetical protein [Francisella adeliensis]QIW11886.1 hypothetical protein FZC43_04160 [Francisella adeliensis]QIW13762.1 hypothetical protein FZC44_04160 [Francisella adeliensis]